MFFDFLDYITTKTLQKIESASVVYVSAISAWEIGLKESRDQLSLPMDSLQWFQESVKNHNLVIANLDIEILINSTRLPKHHKDPVDRFIIATAQKFNAGIVTSDSYFNKYDINIYA